MALLKFENIGIEALSATVPKHVVKTKDFISIFSEEHIKKFISATGIEERRISDSDTCSSDLCFKAACDIFEKTDVKKEDIDVVIFVSQTPDYKTPGSAVDLQSKLGLSKDVIVYDINLACTGFIQGLLMGFTFLKIAEINKVLLLVGDTLSKLISYKDKSSGLLLGDAGTAAILNRDDKYGESFFSLNTDGNYMKAVYVPAGGARNPSSIETLKPYIYDDGSIRSREQLTMQGDDVFSFAISVLPKDIKKLIDFSGKSMSDVDLFAFHQANNFMSNYIAKKAKIDKGKVLHSIQNFGNTAGTSIPLCLSYNRDKIKEKKTILMNAIGSGFTYGTVLLNLVECKIIRVSEI